MSKESAIIQVCEKYGHMNFILQDKLMMPDGLPGQILYDLWQAVWESRAEQIQLEEEKVK